MVKLGDYLSTLFTEITKARVEADLVSLNVAREYGRDEYLKHFPVPHVRVRSIDVTMPVVVEGVDEKSLEEYRKPVDAAIVEKVVAESTNTVLKRNNLKAPSSLASPAVTANKEAVSLRTPITLTKERLVAQTYASIDPRRIADDHAALVIEALKAQKTSLRGLDVSVLEKEIRDEVEANLAKLKPAPPKIDVQVATSKVRESAGKENVTYLTFTIYEDAFEWATSLDEKGNEKRTLTPE